jgi:hypothetical protein
MRRHVRSLAKADFASSSQHVREGQRIAELEAEIDTLQRQALALGAGTSGLAPAVVLGVRIAETKALVILLASKPLGRAGHPSTE